MQRTVLVTGGAGYIGSQTCKALSRAGFLPVSVDNLVHGHRHAVKWGPLVVGDIRDDALLARAMGQYRPCAVLHFAAFAYVGESVADPQRYYDNNIAGTLNLLRAMRNHDCSRIVFSSSCATYGCPGDIPIDEDAPQRPVNPYGWSKLMAEQILRDYDAAYGVTHVSLRYFNAAGADRDGDLGEEHDPETHLIPLAILTALGQRTHLDVFGTDHPTRDGSAIRDYIHVEDLADAHVAALQYLLRGGRSDAVNLGTGRGYSVWEVVRTVEKVSGMSLNARPAPRRAGDPAMLVANAGRARTVLGWRPRYGTLESIIRSAWAWHSRRVGGGQVRPVHAAGMSWKGES